MGALLFAGAILAAGAVFAQDESWTGVMSEAMSIRKGLTMRQAMSGERGVTMEMVKAYAERDTAAPGFESWMDAHFAEVDANGNGLVSLDEIYVWMDKNGVSDSQLTAAWSGSAP